MSETHISDFATVIAPEQMQNTPFATQRETILRPAERANTYYNYTDITNTMPNPDKQHVSSGTTIDFKFKTNPTMLTKSIFRQ